MKKRNLQVITALVLIALVTLACRFSIPGQAPSEETLATSVAATFTALAPHSIPTETAPTAEVGSPTEAVPTVTPAAVTAAFVSAGRDLYVWQEGAASATRLTNDGDVDQAVISSDGTMIAFVRSHDYTDYQLEVIHSDGSGRMTLISFADFAALPRPADSEATVPYQLVWKPGSHTLYMNARIQFMGPGLQIGEQLYQINAETAERSVWMTVSGNWRFGFSPDGSKLTISHPNGVDLYAADGTLIRAAVITHDLINTASEYQWVASPDWQSDSSSFAVGIPPQEPFAETPADSKVYRVTSAGDAALMFTRAISFSSERIATFDHSLGHIGFSMRLAPASDNLWALHVANIDGTNDLTIATGYFSQLPVWSSDDQHFIFSNMSGSTQQAYLGSVDGSTVLLADIPSLMQVRWLDATRYLASSYDGSGYSLLLGTIGSPSLTLFSEPTASGNPQLHFDVNR